MSRVPTSLRRLLPFCFGTNASSTGGIADDQGDTQELIPVTDSDGSSADGGSGSGSEDESPAAPLLPPSHHTLPGAMEKQLPASLSRQHSVNALMRAREPSNSSPPPQEDLCEEDGAGEETPPLQDDPDNERVSTKKGRRWNWRTLMLVVVLWIACIFISASYSMIAPFFPHEAQKKGCSLLVVGLIISASPFCVFTTSPIFGYLLPKFGIRFSMLFGFALVGAAFILLGFLQNIPGRWMFIAAAVILRMTEGVGSSLAFTGMYTLLPELFPSRVGLVMGVFEVGSGLGFALGPPIGGLLYTVGGFLLPFVSVGTTVLLIIPPTFLLYKKTSCQPKVISLKVIRQLSSNFVFVLLLIGQVICLAALGFLNPTFQPFLNEQFGLDELQVGLVFICGPAMYLILASIFGALADKFGTRGFIVCGFMIGGVAFFFVGPATFIATPRLWLTIVAYLLMGVGLAPAFIPSYADLLKIAKTQHPEVNTEVLTGVVSGLTSATLSLGEFIGPLLGATVTQFTGFQTSSVLLGQVLLAQAFLLLGATLIDRFHKHRRQPS